MIQTGHEGVQIDGEEEAGCDRGQREEGEVYNNLSLNRIHFTIS